MVEVYESSGITGSSYKPADAKHPMTGYYLTEQELRRKDADIGAANYEAKEAKRDAKSQIDYAKGQAASEIREAKENAATQIEAMRIKLEAAEAEIDRQKNLNRNLLRITRERANAKRGLQPKKEHSGYRFSSKIMQTKTICDHDKKEGAIYTDVWTATIETPYDASIPIHQIKDQIFEDLRDDGGIFDELYIKSWVFKGSGDLWKGTYAEAMENAKNFDQEGKNILFDYKMMANTKTKLWEIQITTTKSIRALASMMG